MNRRELILAALSPADGAPHSPVQVQKLIFLIQQNVLDIIDEGIPFDFRPYNYGPFDKAIYAELEYLAESGSVAIETKYTWRVYGLTDSGQASGNTLLSSIEPNVRDFIIRTSSTIRRLTFNQLVAAIYRAYPEMRANSVFQG